MTQVECKTLDGHSRLVPVNTLTLRPAAYALIVQQDQVLLLRMKHSGKYHLPGGGIHVGERIIETLKRETREETGVEIEVGKLVHFAELFFYYDPSGQAYHGLHFYYSCRAQTMELLADSEVKDGSAAQPRWVAIQKLRAEEFQSEGEAIIGLCQQAST